MVEPLTPERRREMTRRHLLAAAAQVFARKGFHGATIDDVAAAAGFTKGAVYSNFKNKEELFLALIDERSEQQMAVVRAALDEASSLSVEERFDYYTRLTADTLWADPEWQLLFLEFSLYAARNPRARQRLAERYRLDHDVLVPMIEAELARMGAVPPLPVDQLASIFLALFNGIWLRNAIDPDSADDTLVGAAVQFVSEAILGPEWPRAAK